MSRAVRDALHKESKSRLELHWPGFEDAPLNLTIWAWYLRPDWRTHDSIVAGAFGDNPPPAHGLMVLEKTP